MNVKKCASLTRMTRILAVTILAAALAVQTGCTGQVDQGAGRNGRTQVPGQQGGAAGQGGPAAQQVSPNGLQDGTRDAVIATKDYQGAKYVPLRTLSEVLEFTSDWDPATSTFSVGDNDIAYEFIVNSNEARIEDAVIRFDHPTVSIDGQAYVPAEAVDEMFSEVMNYEWTTDSLRIKPNPDFDMLDAEGIPNFSDDPDDPFAGGENKADPGMSLLPALPAGAAAAAEREDGLVAARSTNVPAAVELESVALKNINTNALIRTAKKYIGVKYKFGAKPYPKSKRFDCSSYTQYVYGKHGVKLPRLSRNQAKKGVAVSRSKLRKGDLMFFYLPGRYKSNKIVGHVGIYMGKGKMIHSSTEPKNGVQIVNVNIPYWKKTYLKSRRVAY